jgi:hypothetical protein
VTPFDHRFIDWTNPAARISKHFTVKEALWLKKWNRMATEDDKLTDHVKKQIVKFAAVMDEIRDFLEVPIVVHCWFRPPGYNTIAGGKKASKHMSIGEHSAVDWHADIEGCKTIAESCDKIRDFLEPLLTDFNIRMEKNPGADWVHCDNAEVIFTRYFRP